MASEAIRGRAKHSRKNFRGFSKLLVKIYVLP